MPAGVLDPITRKAASHTYTPPFTQGGREEEGGILNRSFGDPVYRRFVLSSILLRALHAPFPP